MVKNNKTLIIAEAGVNHNGKIKIAKKLIDIACQSGVDIIKFQTFITKQLLTKKAPKAVYQKKLTNKKESQFEMIKRLELSKNDHIKLIQYCKNKNIEFLSTPFDIPSIDFLISLKLKKIKIPSSEINNILYLKNISKFKGHIILSTGMSTIKEIRSALNVLLKNGVKRNFITILHCNSEYPTPFKDVNLLAMLEIKKKFRTKIGYSDHTRGIEVPIAAVAIGANVIEKHFTLNRNMTGPDHKASLNPKELKEMVKAIRNTEIALGSNKKIISFSEKKNIKTARKSIIAIQKIEKGERFTSQNISAKRPGTGISPMKFYQLIGNKSKRTYREDELLDFKEL